MLKMRSFGFQYKPQKVFVYVNFHFRNFPYPVYSLVAHQVCQWEFLSNDFFHMNWQQ
ncbi:MAG: hypothetical protein ACI9L9_002251 [Marivirga sp.]|jgi:hypothetical protein